MTTYSFNCKNLVIARKKANLTQVQLAEKLGLHTSTVSSWEIGKRRPYFDTMIQVCIVLCASPFDLVLLNQ